MNNFSFTGNLGNAAEQKFIPSGDSIVSFSVAVKSGFGKNESTMWVRCQLWGKRGESVLPYLNKGQLVGVTGELSNREWKDKEGQQKFSLELRVNDVTLLGKSDGTAPEKQPANSKPSFDDLGDDIPFN